MAGQRLIANAQSQRVWTIAAQNFDLGGMLGNAVADPLFKNGFDDR
ncbi:MAG: hypothetical protein ABI843_11360 [Dokdonella sp.]